MDTLAPIEAKDYPGYFEITQFGRYVISPKGEVIYRRTGRVVEGGFNPDGYFNFGLTRDDGYRFTWGRHRLMCFVFKNPGVPIDDLVVNHKNAIKGDDRLDNLEWTTYQGNAEHAGALGITEKCLPVSVRDSVTGEVKHYPSAIECARQLGMTKDAVLYRINAGDTKVFPEKRQYRKYSLSAWHIPRDLDKALLVNGTSKRVLVRSVVTGYECEYEKLSDLATALGVSAPVVTLWMIRDDQPVLPGYIQLRWAHEEGSWREVKDPIWELSQYTGKKPVVVEGDEVQLFESASACAKAQGIGASTLNLWLAKGKNGYRYYTVQDFDGPTSQQWLDRILSNCWDPLRASSPKRNPKG